MLTLLSTAISIACIFASARRLASVISPTALDLTLLANAVEVGRQSAVSKLHEAVRHDPSLRWESDLLVAFRGDVGALGARDGLINEQLLDLDWRIQRWSRIPRVCASVATSAGFLCAVISLIGALELPDGQIADAGVVRAELFSALDALSVGIAATVFCIAVHLRTQRLAKRRLAAADRLMGELGELTTAL